MTQYFGYGITDDFMVDGSIKWTPDSVRRVTEAGGELESLDSSGFENPAFGATYRLVDQASAPVSFDLFGSYAPNLFSADSASATRGGTVAAGEQSGSVGAAVSQETRDFTIRGAVAGDFYGNANSVNLSNDDTIHVNSRTNVVASLNTQTRLTDLFSVNAGFSYTFADKETVTNLFNSQQHFSAPGDTAAVDVALNYQFIPNALVFAVTYDYSSTGNSWSTFGVPAEDNGVRNRDSNAVGLRISYATL